MFKFFSNTAVKPAAQEAAERARLRQANRERGDATGNAQADRARERGQQQEQSLSDSTVAWANQLAADLQPHDLLERYPRVANRLALCWSDPLLTSRLFDSLLQDRRGGRRGFPEGVKANLIALCRYHNAHRAVATSSSQPWDLLATSDR